MNRLIQNLTTGLAITFAFYAYAEEGKKVEFKNTEQPLLWEAELKIVNPPESVPDGISGIADADLTTLTPYFDAGCALFGVHDGGLNDSRFFCVHQNDEGKVNGQWFFGDKFSGFDVEGLDYDGNFLYFSSGNDTGGQWAGLGFNGAVGTVLHPSDFLVENCRFDAAVAFDAPQVNGYPLTEVDGITFIFGHMVGWSSNAGLFVISAPNVLDNRKNAQLLLPLPREVEDIEFLNNKIYGVMNLEPDQYRDINATVQAGQVMTVNLVEYDPFTNPPTTSFPCESQMNAALETAGFKSAEIEALEVLPQISPESGQPLLLGFHATPIKGKQSALVLGVLDLNTCGLALQQVEEISTTDPIAKTLDVEGLAMVCPRT